MVRPCGKLKELSLHQPRKEEGSHYRNSLSCQHCGSNHPLAGPADEPPGSVNLSLKLHETLQASGAQSSSTWICETQKPKKQTNAA